VQSDASAGPQEGRASPRRALQVAAAARRAPRRRFCSLQPLSSTALASLGLSHPRPPLTAHRAMAAGAYPAGPAPGAGTAGGGYAPPSGPSSRAAVRVLLRIKPTAAFEDSGMTVEADGQARS